MAMVAERDTPAAQCTRTRPPNWYAVRMNSNAASNCSLILNSQSAHSNKCAFRKISMITKIAFVTPSINGQMNGSEEEGQRTVGNPEPAISNARGLEDNLAETYFVGYVEHVGDLICLKPQRILCRACTAHEQPLVDGRRVFAARVGSGRRE
jgi:hypothetical protein